jgi:hypothetical protein
MGRANPILLLAEDGVALDGIEGEFELLHFSHRDGQIDIQAARLRHYVSAARRKIEQRWWIDDVFGGASAISFGPIIDRTTKRIALCGMALQPIADLCQRQIIQRMNTVQQLSTTIVLSNPRALSTKQRMRDEQDSDQYSSDIAKITGRLLLSDDIAPGIRDGRFEIKWSDLYPTIAVCIFDDDLYAYFYAHGRRGTESPILHFTNFRKNPVPCFSSAILCG